MKALNKKQTIIAVSAAQSPFPSLLAPMRNASRIAQADAILAEFDISRWRDTRTFTLKALQLIDQAPAPVVLHGMGKDAKAIKFMVNAVCR